MLRSIRKTVRGIRGVCPGEEQENCGGKTSLSVTATVVESSNNIPYLCCLPGAVCVFTGLLSVAFLGRRILPYMWLGIWILMMGLVVIGVSDAIFIGIDKDANGIISGSFQ